MAATRAEMAYLENILLKEADGFWWLARVSNETLFDLLVCFNVCDAVLGRRVNPESVNRRCRSCVVL